MRAFSYPELPDPEPDYPKLKMFTFKDCKDNKEANKPDRHSYCSRRFTTRHGETIYCNCECHMDEPND